MCENKNYSIDCNKKKLFLWQKSEANKNKEPPQYIINIIMFYFVYFLYNLCFSNAIYFMEQVAFDTAS
jgi:hypothetical protein